MEAPTLREADAVKFGDDARCSLFNDTPADFGEPTAIDRFGQVLAAVVAQEADDVAADRALLDSCVRFARISGYGFEGVRLDELRGRHEPLVITPANVPRIGLLRDETPGQQAARVAGVHTSPTSASHNHLANAA